MLKRIRPGRRKLSLKRDLTAALFRALLYFAVFTTVFLLSSNSAQVRFLDMPEVIKDKPPALSEVLIKNHKCWTGPAPKEFEGKIPGHAVVTLQNGKTLYGAKYVDPALKEIFTDEGSGILVHGFCP